MSLFEASGPGADPVPLVVVASMFHGELLDLMCAANSIVALSGAGVSAESGIPTFRDAMTGLWARFNPEELATPQAFAKDPQLVSRWYDQRRCDVLKREGRFSRSIQSKRRCRAALTGRSEGDATRFCRI